MIMEVAWLAFKKETADTIRDNNFLCTYSSNYYYYHYHYHYHYYCGLLSVIICSLTESPIPHKHCSSAPQILLT